MLLKKEGTLFIKPTHTNPVFYRPLNGKTIHLTKDAEQELKDGDQIGLLPTSYFFRVSITKDSNKTTDEHPLNGAINHTDISSVQNKDSVRFPDACMSIFLDTLRFRINLNRQVQINQHGNYLYG